MLYVAQGEKKKSCSLFYFIDWRKTPKWILGAAPSMPLKCTAKFRYRQGDIPVTVNILEDGNLYIKYDYPVKAVTPGQVAVLYQDEVCLGGCIIKSIEPLEQQSIYI